MATKTVAWNSGNGVITLTYTGQGNGSVSVKSDANDSFDERSQNLNIVTTAGSPEKAVQLLVKQAGKPLGWTTKDFDYTGSVQEVTLPKGRYKLQCWGAQGGNVTGAYASTGSKGGYSEGIITLTETTTLYIFVGGQGGSYTSSASQTDTTVLNGGWNGGGAGIRTSRYSSGGEDGRSFPRGGGGATDIALVTSSMNYSSGRTNRSSASLLSRIIVAGGGGGASSQVTTTSTTIEEQEIVQTISVTTVSTNATHGAYGSYRFDNPEIGGTYNLANSTGTRYVIDQYNGSTWLSSSINKAAIIKDNCTRLSITVYSSAIAVGDIITADLIKVIATTSTTTTSSRSQGTDQGGGVNGIGAFYGRPSVPGSGGAFGLGGNQEDIGGYASGAGGGGWYGGGRGSSATNKNYINYSGGGSGFVNTANASYRPSGYTGLLLDSGSTTAGNSSHPSVSGGTEVGHSGNGYVRITVIN